MLHLKSSLSLQGEAEQSVQWAVISSKEHPKHSYLLASYSGDYEPELVLLDGHMEYGASLIPSVWLTYSG